MNKCTLMHINAMLEDEVSRNHDYLLRTIRELNDNDDPSKNNRVITALASYAKSVRALDDVQYSIDEMLEAEV